MWPGFDPSTRCHMWVEFVDSLLCTERFSPATPVSPLLKNQHLTNLVPRSHSVTGNVRSGKVRQYTIFHWLLKNGCGNAIYAPIGLFRLFRGALNEGLVFASSCAVLNKCQLCGGKFCFSDAGKALQLRKIILKICDVCVNGTDESTTYPALE